MYALNYSEYGLMYYFCLLVAFIIINIDFKYYELYFKLCAKYSSVYIDLKIRLYTILILHPNYINNLVIFIRSSFLVVCFLSANLDCYIYNLESCLEGHFYFSPPNMNFNPSSGDIPGNSGSGGSPLPNNGGPSNNTVLATGYNNSVDSRPTDNSKETSIFWYEDKPRRIELADQLEDAYINRAVRRKINLASEGLNLTESDKRVILKHLTWNYPDSEAYLQYHKNLSFCDIVLSKSIIKDLRN